jgi:hypothetical protein
MKKIVENLKTSNFLNYMNIKSKYLRNKKNNLTLNQRYKAFVINYKEFLYYSIAILESSKFDRTKKVFLTFCVLYGIYLLVFVFSEIRTSQSMMFRNIHEKAKSHQTNDYINNKSDLNRLTYAYEITRYY